MQSTDNPEPLTLEKFNQQHASLVEEAEAISNRRDANLVEAAAALNARYGGNETPKTLLTRIAQSLPDLPYRPNPKEKATTMPTTETTTSPIPPWNYDVIPGLPPQKLEPITINSAVTQIIAQPGDGTRYRIILTECPVDYLAGTPQHLLSAMTGDKGHSMFITIDYKNVRDGGFYLHPTYIEEKFGPGSTYLSKMVAHTMNLLFSKTYITILKNLLALPTEERDYLPPVFQTDQAIKAEIAHPHAIWNNPEE